MTATQSSKRWPKPSVAIRAPIHQFSTSSATPSYYATPPTRCVWLIAYERAEQDGRASDLRRLQRPIDQRKWGQSSWVNYWLGRDEGLWTDDEGLRAGRNGRRVELPILPSVAPASPR